MNELGGKRQTNFDKERIRGIVKAARGAPVTRAAATYLYWITKHPFRGANRRTAYFAAEAFLRKNGYVFTREFTHSEMRRLFTDIRDKNIPFMDAEERLNKFIVKL